MEFTDLTAIRVVKPWDMGLILTIFSCLIISTNLVVAAALLRLLLKRGTQSWCFMFNLVLADTLVGVAITGLATEDISEALKDQWTNSTTNSTQLCGGKTTCLMRMSCVMSPCIASILSMLFISLDRYVAIKMPLKYYRLSGKGTAVTFLLILWILSFTVGFSPVVVPQLQTNGYSGFCALFAVVHHEGMMVLFLCCFFPVLFTFVFIYLDILKISYSHQKQIFQIKKAGSRMAQRNHHHQREHHHNQQMWMRFVGHMKAVRTVALLIGCLVVLWAPFFVACLVHLLCRSCPITEMLENYLWLLGMCNSLINPIVYACWQREVRLQLAAIFFCCTGRVSTARSQHATGRCNPQPCPLTQPAFSGENILNPLQLQPIVTNDKVHTVQLSNLTNP